MQRFPCLKPQKMRFTPRILPSEAAETYLATAVANYYRSLETEINEVMTISKLTFGVLNYFDKLISLIGTAKHSVHVCMPCIHNPVIQGPLVNLIKATNIKVRILIDRAGYSDSAGVFLKDLVEAGADIKFKERETMLQEKFCLVDDEVLITGTLHWGTDLSSDDWNYVYITNKFQLVEPVQRKFYINWGDCQTTIQDVMMQENDAVIEDVHAQEDLSAIFEIMFRELPN